jgi:exonuclease VII large subunit
LHRRFTLVCSLSSVSHFILSVYATADDDRADKSVAEFISEFLREDKVKFEEDNRRLKKEIKEIRETHRTEMEKLMDEMKRMNAENTQRFKQLDEQRKDLEDQMERKVSGLCQEHKVDTARFREEIEEGRRELRMGER